MRINLKLTINFFTFIYSYNDHVISFGLFQFSHSLLKLRAYPETWLAISISFYWYTRVPISFMSFLCKAFSKPLTTSLALIWIEMSQCILPTLSVAISSVISLLTGPGTKTLGVINVE